MLVHAVLSPPRRAPCPSARAHTPASCKSFASASSRSGHPYTPCSEVPSSCHDGRRFSMLVACTQASEMSGRPMDLSDRVSDLVGPLMCSPTPYPAGTSLGLVQMWPSTTPLWKLQENCSGPELTRLSMLVSVVQYLSDAFDLKVGEDDMTRWLSTDQGGAVVRVQGREVGRGATGRQRRTPGLLLPIWAWPRKCCFAPCTSSCRL